MMSKINSKSKKSLITAVLAIVVLAAIGILVYMSTSVDVEVDPVINDDIYRSIEDVGKVRSEKSVALQSVGTGRVLSVLVEVGDQVKAGNVLVKVDDSALRYQLESLEYQTQSPGSYIEGSVTITKENYLKAREDYNKAKALFELGAISESELKSLELLSTVSRTNYIMALDELDAVKLDGDEAAKLYNAQIQALIPQIESLENQIKEYEIKTSFDGTVGEIYVEEDQYVMPMSAVVQIYENKYYIESSLLEESLVQMELDAPVEISFDSTFIDGYVRKIYPMIKTVISDLGVAQQKGIVEIASDYDFSLMGREVELKFILGQKKGVLTVDKDALFKRGRESYVFVAVGNRAELRQVKVGAVGNTRSEILEGLEINESVIISPVDEVEEGDRISY